jgi:hypothetical protein
MKRSVEEKGKRPIHQVCSEHTATATNKDSDSSDGSLAEFRQFADPMIASNAITLFGPTYRQESAYQLRCPTNAHQTIIVKMRSPVVKAKSLHQGSAELCIEKVMHGFFWCTASTRGT